MWSHPEGELRWGGKDAGLRLPVDPKLDYTLTFTGGVPVGGAVLADGVEIGRMDGRPGNDHTWSFAVPSGLLKGSTVLRLQFRMEPLKLATDPRELCVYPRSIVLEASGANIALDAPRIGEVKIDRAGLAASTTHIGLGRVISMRPDDLATSEFAHVVARVLLNGVSSGVPACAVPDGAADGLFVTCRGNEVLVYNSTDKPIRATLRLPAGAELDRGHRAAGQTIDLRDLPPDGIAAFGLRTVLGGRLPSGRPGHTRSARP